ncbi:MAG: hypothetical protein WAZ12_02865 [Candidatus Absconditicoccaceae bacterium]
MGKVIWTTIFWALILVIAGFYLKFMDQEVGQMVSNRIMTTETTIDTNTTSGDVLSGDLDPMQAILSGVTAMQQQLVEGLSGLNLKLDETKTLIEDGAKGKTVSTVTIKPEVKLPVETLDGTGVN